jgi:5-methylcytosine-specific restriction protein A
MLDVDMRQRLPDSIPSNFIVNAIRSFDNGASHKFGPSTFYDLFYENRRYPPKAIVGLAAEALSGNNYGPDDFSGGLDSKSFKLLWDAGFEIIFKTDNQPLPEEVLPTEKYAEGAVLQVLLNAYERNEKARRDAIKHHGCACKVCGFDFEVVYGSIGAGFIHVHHIVPLSSIGKEYIVNPKTDLIPVCPNCHAMIHRKSPPFLVPHRPPRTERRSQNRSEQQRVRHPQHRNPGKLEERQRRLRNPHRMAPRLCLAESLEVRQDSPEGAAHHSGRHLAVSRGRG